MDDKYHQDLKILCSFLSSVSKFYFGTENMLICSSSCVFKQAFTHAAKYKQAIAWLVLNVWNLHV